MAKVLAVFEHRDGQLRKTASQVATAATELAAALPGSSVVGLIVGNGVSTMATTAGGFGVTDIAVVDLPALERFSHGGVSAAIAKAATLEGADVVLMTSSTAGKEFAARVAVRLEAGLVPDCIALAVSGGEIIATRPVYAGKAQTDVKVTTPRKVFSLRPNVFTARAVSGSDAQVRSLAVEIAAADCSDVVTGTMVNSGKLDVAEADIIVSGGRGLKAPEHFHLVEELATELHAAVGASRAVVDAGWRSHGEQVGQTGKTVSPSMYIACGISGAVQHLAGMSSSKCIVAINKDKDAPIFSVADYGIVGDVFDVLPALVTELKHFHGN